MECLEGAANKKCRDLTSDLPAVRKDDAIVDFRPAENAVSFDRRR
jgi:hypothetical protein